MLWGLTNLKISLKYRQIRSSPICSTNSTEKGLSELKKTSKSVRCQGPIVRGQVRVRGAWKLALATGGDAYLHMQHKATQPASHLVHFPISKNLLFY